MHLFIGPQSKRATGGVAKRNSSNAGHLSAALRAGVMMAPLLCCFLATAVSARDRVQSREDSGSSSSSVARCLPLADLRDSIESRGGTLVSLTPEQFQFARGMYVASEAGPMELPPGDRAMVGELPGGDAGVVFVDGDSACGLALLGGSGLQMLLTVGSSSVSHVGNGT